MGQRLTVGFVDRKRKFLNCYYHWSAYTVSAVTELEAFFNGYRNVTGRTKGVYDERLHVIRALMYASPEQVRMNKELEKSGNESSRFLINYGARFSVKDEPFARKEYPNVKFPPQGKRNRSCGLICISGKEMADAEAWAEAVLTVNLDKAVFDFPMFFEYPDYETYLKETALMSDDEEFRTPEEKIPVYPYGEFIRFADFADFRKLIVTNELGLLRRPTGEILAYVQ